MSNDNKKPADQQGTTRKVGPFPAPKNLPGFPAAKRSSPRTPKGDGKLRKRWVDDDGRIYEWDYQHGAIEVYDQRGNHIGEFDYETGERLKGPNPNRKVEP